MSDNWTTLIPEDPRCVPDAVAQENARQHLAAIAPDAESIEVIVHERIQFFDCGSNFKSIQCPECGKAISTEWWQERMDDDYDDGFKLATYQTPCCGKSVTLNDLIYNWPQGLARFAISAMNPNIGCLSEEQIKEFAEIAGCSLRAIYQHI